MVGYLLIFVGLVGGIYLGFIYVVWPRSLPKFSATALNAFREVTITGGGFGDMLVGDEVTANSSSGLAIDRQLNSGGVLGVQDQTDVRVSIPRLGIDRAQVELNVNGQDESIYDRVLTRAVAHLRGSALPGTEGNTFLFGHSKLPILASNDYESIFTDLPKVKVGDIVEVLYDGKKYTYQISQTGVVDPSDVFIMNQPQGRRMITLMTCIPPGFANQRYVTVGDLVKVE